MTECKHISPQTGTKASQEPAVRALAPLSRPTNGNDDTTTVSANLSAPKAYHISYYAPFGGAWSKKTAEQGPGRL